MTFPAAEWSELANENVRERPSFMLMSDEGDRSSARGKEPCLLAFSLKNEPVLFAESRDGDTIEPDIIVLVDVEKRSVLRLLLPLLLPPPHRADALRDFEWPPTLSLLLVDLLLAHGSCGEENRTASAWGGSVVVVVVVIIAPPVVRVVVVAISIASSQLPLLVVRACPWPGVTTYRCSVAADLVMVGDGQDALLRQLARDSVEEELARVKDADDVLKMLLLLLLFLFAPGARR